MFVTLLLGCRRQWISVMTLTKVLKIKVKLIVCVSYRMLKNSRDTDHG